MASVLELALFTTTPPLHAGFVRTQDLGERGSGAAQTRVNNDVWGNGDFVGGYATRHLRPVEVILLARYREAFTGRVLELGCGAGRLTGYLIQLGGEVLGIDLSPKMVDYCRRAYPGGSFEQGDLQHAHEVARGTFDVVLMGNNLIDVLSDEERRHALATMAPLLGEQGLLVFSSHNRAHEPSIPEPIAAVRSGGTVEAVHRAARLPWWIANRRRLRPLEIRTDGYAVLNDDAHDYRLLHYYIGRDEQERQLADLAYSLVECIDENGDVVKRGERAAAYGELHYIARRTN